LREKSRHLSRVIGAALVSAVAAATLAACGGGGGTADQFANEAPGEYPVEVIGSSFEPRQTIAETYDMRLRVRNSGDETIPAINTTIDLPGQTSTLAFAYRTEQEGVAQPQRPVWVLEEGYPKLAGTVGRGGTATSNRRTFNFGELPPGEVAEMVWRLTAVEPGDFRIRWQMSAGLGLDTSAVDAQGRQPTGILPVSISSKARLTEIDENGNVVPLDPAQQRALELQEAN
jgi:hypothetical protein